MSNFNMDTFLKQLNSVKESVKEATTPEESALVGQAAATAEAPGGSGVAANEATAEAAGLAAGSAAVQEHATAVADELADVDKQLGASAADPRVALERKLERLSGQQLSADAETEMAVDTAISAPPNAVNMAKGAEEVDTDDHLIDLLAQIQDTLSKEASEDESDAIMKQAQEAVQFGRVMALGFVDQLKDLMIEDEDGE